MVGGWVVGSHRRSQPWSPVPCFVVAPHAPRWVVASVHVEPGIAVGVEPGRPVQVQPKGLFVFQRVVPQTFPSEPSPEPLLPALVLAELVMCYSVGSVCILSIACMIVLSSPAVIVVY